MKCIVGRDCAQAFELKGAQGRFGSATTTATGKVGTQRRKLAIVERNSRPAQTADEMIPCPAEDHHCAGMLWRAIRSKAPALVWPEAPQTNIVFLLPEGAARALSGADWEAELAQHGVLVRARTSGLIRMVVHRHISDDDIARAASVVQQRLTT